MSLKLFTITFLLCLGELQAQIKDLSVSQISPELILNANAVLRDDQTTIEVDASNKMTIYKIRSVTVMNEYGQRHVQAYQYYDSERKIKKLKATIYNAAGKEIKKYKQKDFKDRSAVGSGDLYTDNRVQYLDHTAQSYPYTVVFESETKTGTTVFIDPWQPVSGYYLSVENSSYSLLNPGQIALRKEELNFEQQKISKNITPTLLEYNLKKVPAYKMENLSPVLDKFVPMLKVALDEFALVGVIGQASNWLEFGKWQHDNLLMGKDKLPAATLHKISQLTKDAESEIEKAKIIYQYVQDNTRYISVQLGIGGWEPMLAEDVDRLGYGDCKALTNYTKALLDSQDILSHYAIVFAGEERKDLDLDFASMQGNHVILNIPLEEEDVWLECTSQTMPFNYLGDFTDNRNVLLVKPEGGEIVKTKAYAYTENVRETFSKIKLDNSGSYTAEVKRKSEGIPYGNIYHLIRESKENQVLYYKNHWGHLQNINFQQIFFDNNRDDRRFIEEIKFSGQKLTSKAGNRLLLSTHFFTTPTYNLNRSTDRKLPFEIERGYTYRDVFEFQLPENYSTESIPEEEMIQTQFGTYKVKLEAGEKEGKNTITMVREYILYDGIWPAELYSEFYAFMNKINSLNNQKAVIIAGT